MVGGRSKIESDDRPAGATRPRLEWLLVLLSLEKTLQHGLVTWAFMADVAELRREVALDWRWFAAGGALVGALFVVATAGLLARRHWSLILVSGLAVADIVGEFVAQGTPAITITASFVVAVVILAVAPLVAMRRHRSQDT